MKNLINYLSKKSLSLGNGSGMTRKWFGNDSGMTRLCLASLICLCMLTIGVGNVWGDSQTFTKSDINASNTSATKPPITVSIDGTVSVSGQQFRFASGKAMTVTSSSGNITRIDVTTNSTEAYLCV